MKNPILLCVLSVLCVLCVLCGSTAVSAAPKKIVFISHQSSHGRGAHEYAAGSQLIGHWLEKAYGDRIVREHHINWPADPEKAFAGASTVVFFCSGGGRHLVNGHVPEFDKVMRRGVGLACLHWAVEVPIGPSGKGMLNWMGGYFESNWSVNPHWKADFTTLPNHPAANGVKPFAMDDEWYFHMRFRGDMENVTPILSAVAPDKTMERKDGSHSGNPAVRKAVAAREPQHVGWTYQRGADYKNGRGFGFTGLHYHWNFENDDFRKAVLNGIAWSAGLEVPENGVESPRPSRRDLELSLEGVLPGQAATTKPASDEAVAVTAKPLFKSKVVTAMTPGHAIDIDVAIPAGTKELYLVVADAGDGKSHDWADWAEARFVTADGKEKRLVDLEWMLAKGGHGRVHKNANSRGEPMGIDGKSVGHGIGTHAPSMIVFEVPKGAKKFRARGGLDDGGVGRSDVASVQFLVFNAAPDAGGKVASVSEAVEEYVKKSSAPGRDASEAVASLDVHPQLAATLFASEPMMASPTSIDIDHEGRVWICDVVNYRRNQGKRPEGDRILILEDTDGDAKADKSTVFYQGLDVDSAHGICVLGDRAIVSAGEDIFYLIDDDGDDKADRKELLFTKTGAAQHDHNIHAVHFGPDGRLYFNFGNSVTQLCDKDGKLVVDLAGNAVEEHRQPYQEGMVLRCDLDGRNVETLGWNFRNNWEVCVDSFGTIWQSDNDDDGNLGVRINYVMEFGNYGYKDEITGAGWRDPRAGMHEEIPLRHWHQNDPGVVPNFVQTGAGSPTGICVYEGDMLPKLFRNQVIHCDAGPNVCRAYPAVPDGAGYTGEMVDILKSTRDRWFRPSDVSVAPDGSIFVADWYDPGVGGHGMGDIEKGRIFRVTPVGKESSRFTVQGSRLGTVEGALEALLSPNEAARYLGWTALAEMGARAEGALKDVFIDETRNARHRARALWLLGRLKASYVETAFADADAEIRITALRAARLHWRDQGPRMLDAVAKLANDADPRVRRECAIALRFDGSARADALWAKLAARHDGKDRWYLEALGIGADLHWDGRVSAYQKAVKGKENVPGLSEILWRSRASSSAAAIAMALLDQRKSDAAPHFLRALQFQPGGDAKDEAYRMLFRKGGTEVALAAAAELGPETIKGMPGGEKRLDKLIGPIRGTADFVNIASRLSLTGFGGELADYIAAHPDTNEAVAAANLILGSPAEARAMLRLFKHGKELDRARAVAGALGKTGDRTAADILAVQLRKKETPAVLKRDLVSGLALSTQGGRALLKVAQDGQLDAALHPLAAIALARNPDENLRAGAARHLDVPAGAGTENLPPLAELVRLKGNAGKGQAAFSKATCNTCHRVKGEGIDFGPDLTEIGNKLAREAMFESILYPSNAISEGFHGMNLKTVKGDTFIGYIIGETDEAVTLRMAGGISQEYKVTDIKKRAVLELSLMPPGLAAILTPQELADLVAYLQSLK